MIRQQVEPKWLEWAKQIQSLAQAGLTYSKDVYDLERFEELRRLSVEIMAEHTGVERERVTELFASGTGYQTPKVDIRAAVFRDDKILMVRETLDGRWSLPGGWADVGYSPAEVAAKEVKEEAGFDVMPVRLLAVFDPKFHAVPPSPYHVYKLFFRCELIGGEAATSIETSAVEFFGEEELPPLSTERNTEAQIRRLFGYLRQPEQPTYFE
ncbi:ADP-ribose pyrophosphatase [Paenibacillus sp. J31TS4]|uniref:NUDIX hydrolase n=1 Tax=Paenibacillus sp. J31TS4 TaxID=2807195 RepID=UPI001B256D94|nr:NUDIX hydrolase [Paenibacillus sp. J31TS4]GIP41097.1 ADP-ribose pyrophosphatase [Paenibacillus sp. J31TS4]